MTQANSISRAATMDEFTAAFGHVPDTVFQAPGRVNLIGEHTDYNDGFVLPCAIDCGTHVAVRARDDDRVEVVAVDFGAERDVFRLASTIERDDSRSWPNYVRGVISQLQARGHDLSGAEMLVLGNVPKGAGLSSSASLEVAVGAAMRHVSALELSNADLAVVGQEAENRFVGMQCGIMDQMVSACGSEGRALLLDCRSLETELVPIPPSLGIMIVNSNVQRGLVDSEYNTRRVQCEEASRLLGIKALRDIDLTSLVRRESDLPEVVYRRARHIVSENERTLAAASALKSADVATLARLMAQSHDSMRDDFEITVPPIDHLVKTLQNYLGNRGGARMTGGGFGGCVVALMPHELLAGAQARVADTYEAHTGLVESTYVFAAADGAGELTGQARSSIGLTPS